MTDDPDVTIGIDVYDDDGTKLGTVRGITDYGFAVSTGEGIKALSDRTRARGPSVRGMQRVSETNERIGWGGVRTVRGSAAASGQRPRCCCCSRIRIVVKEQPQRTR